MSIKPWSMSRLHAHVLIMNLIGFASMANARFVSDHSDANPLASPAPKGINSLCLDEWSRHKELIINKRDSLYYVIGEKEKYNRNKEKIQHEINSLKARMASLDKVLDLVNTLEKVMLNTFLNLHPKPKVQLLMIPTESVLY